MDKKEEALNFVNQAIEKYNDLFPNSHFLRGKIYRSLNNFHSAIDCYNKYIALEPNDYNTYFERGLIYLLLNDPEKAAKDFNEAVEINPSYKDKVAQYLNPKQNEVQLAVIHNNATQEITVPVEEKRLDLKEENIEIEFTAQDLQKIIDDEKKLSQTKEKLKNRKIKFDINSLDPLLEKSNSANCSWWIGKKIIKNDDPNLIKLGYGKNKEKSKVHGFIDTEAKEVQELIKNNDKAFARFTELLKDSKFSNGFTDGLKPIDNSGQKKIMEIKIHGTRGKGDIRLWAEKVKNSKGEILYCFDKVGYHI